MWWSGDEVELQSDPKVNSSVLGVYQIKKREAKKEEKTCGSASKGRW